MVRCCIYTEQFQLKTKRYTTVSDTFPLQKKSLAEEKKKNTHEKKQSLKTLLTEMATSPQIFVCG